MENNIKAIANYVFKINKKYFLPHFLIFFPNICEDKQIANGDIANIKPDI